MTEHDVEVCSMEVSSHAIDQHRVDGIVFDVAGFTNLSQDHLDYHPGMDDYFAAKAALFTPDRCRRAVICVDDGWGRRLAAAAAAAGVAVSTVSTGPGRRRSPARRRRTGQPTGRWCGCGPWPDGPAAEVRSPDGTTVSVESPLPGSFNLANTVLALAMLVTAGIDATAGPPPWPPRRACPDGCSRSARWASRHRRGRRARTAARWRSSTTPIPRTRCRRRWPRCATAVSLWWWCWGPAVTATGPSVR